MKQKVRSTNGILWLAQNNQADVAEMDENYERVTGRLQWKDSAPTPAPPAPKPAPEPIEKEEVEEDIVTLSADELLEEDE